MCANQILQLETDDSCVVNKIANYGFTNCVNERNKAELKRKPVAHLDINL